MTNREIARVLDRIAELLESQGASPHRSRPWREAAQSLREQPREVVDVLHESGRGVLDEAPHIGSHIGARIVELIKTGTCSTLDRLQVDETHEGKPHVAGLPLRHPPVPLLLEIDREYRLGAAAGTLPKIAPRRYNPTGEAWLPILHADRGGYSFTAVFSNTELAHRLERTADWVVIYYHEPHRPEGRATVVTEHQGTARGMRVVRGRERECIPLFDVEPDANRQAG
jgi:hypothetical protein